MRAFSFLLFVLFLPISSFAAEEPQVRVAILQNVSSARITLLEPCRLKDLRSGELLAKRATLLWQEVKSAPKGLSIGGKEFSPDAILLEGRPHSIFRVNARPYRGSLILLRSATGKITIVNRLDLEQYLVGAIASETDPHWPPEVLKAHAVVSRTMVAHRIWIRKDQPFDVTADTATHLYYGVSAERDTTRRAVEETKGQVLTFNGELFSTTFHANCGGYTESASELWELKKKLPPLEGSPDPYCKDLKHYRWNGSLSREEFQATMGKETASLGKWSGVEVIDRNRSGRVRTVRLIGSQGETILTGRRFRELLGANRLRSLNFTIEPIGAEVSFSGFGWGHGVGFCQWGGYGMARQGKKMDEILAQYFPGARRQGLGRLLNQS